MPSNCYFWLNLLWRVVTERRHLWPNDPVRCDVEYCRPADTELKAERILQPSIFAFLPQKDFFLEPVIRLAVPVKDHPFRQNPGQMGRSVTVKGPVFGRTESGVIDIRALILVKPQTNKMSHR